MSEWQPIETAPMNGQQIDLWVVFPNGGVRWANARWIEAGMHCCSGPANWCSQSRFPLHAFTEKPFASHWMPIPAPPEGMRDRVAAFDKGEGK